MNTFYKRININNDVHEPSLYDVLLSYNTVSYYTKFFDRDDYYYRLDYCDNIKCIHEEIHKLGKLKYLRLAKFHKHSKNISINIFEIPNNIDRKKIYSIKFANEGLFVMAKSTDTISSNQLELYKLDVFLCSISEINEGNIEKNDDTLEYIYCNPTRLDMFAGMNYYNHDKYSLIYGQSYGNHKGFIAIYKNGIILIELCRNQTKSPLLYFTNNNGIMVFYKDCKEKYQYISHIKSYIKLKKYYYIEFCLETGIIINKYKYFYDSANINLDYLIINKFDDLVSINNFDVFIKNNSTINHKYYKRNNIIMKLCKKTKKIICYEKCNKLQELYQLSLVDKVKKKTIMVMLCLENKLPYELIEIILKYFYCD